MSQISEAYAGAFFDLAVENDSLETILDIFSGIADGLKEYPSFLSHPKLSLKDKETIFKSVTDDSLALHFLNLLARQDRLEHLNDIITDLQETVLKMKHVKTVHVYSKLSLTEAQMKKIEALFQRQGADKVEIKIHLDESLLGGIRLSYDDKVFDDSVEATYDTLQQMLN